jgi:transposase
MVVVCEGGEFSDTTRMAKAYSDDLRRRILQTYEQGEGSEARLAQRFRVSVSYVKKIRRQLRHTGTMERVPHHPGRKPKFTPPVREQLRRWLEQQPDLTLAELQEQLRQQVRVSVSLPSLWMVLRKIGMRLKKSHSTRKNATRKQTGNGGERSWKPSARSRRRS